MDPADHGRARGPRGRAAGGGKGILLSLGLSLAVLLSASPAPVADTPIQNEQALRRAMARFEEVAGPLDPLAYALPEVPEFENAAIEAGRAVVRVALEVRRRGLRDGAYPVDVTDDPATATPLSLAGRPLRVERLEDGSAVVEAVGSEEVWKAQHGPDTPAPPFRVTLPAITPPASHGRGAAPS